MFPLPSMKCCHRSVNRSGGNAETAVVIAGANGAITQYFYNADAYFHFVDAVHKLGVAIPIIPGIMPISNFTQLRRFSESCGAEIPRWISKRMQAFGDDAECGWWCSAAAAGMQLL